MKKIFLDTNFLLIPSQFKIDIFSEINRIMFQDYEIFILDKTIDELNKISKDKKQSLKNRRAVKLALQLVKAKKIKIILAETNLSVDDILAGLTEPKEYIIATQDIALKKRLRKNNIPVIFLAGKKILKLIG